jgi:hypothetical protein
MSYDRWKTKSPDDGVHHLGDEKPDPGAERAEYEDRMAQMCICCANGNDLPEGEKCEACGRVGPAIRDHGLRLRDVSNDEVRSALSSQDGATHE